MIFDHVHLIDEGTELKSHASINDGVDASCRLHSRQCKNLLSDILQKYVSRVATIQDVLKYLALTSTVQNFFNLVMAKA